ncbi:MAG TPA: surface-adhesin E family protein [Novosphingobium sp.]|nr:surface-adhesin E family protein [Novosphingobium sp.]
MRNALAFAFAFVASAAAAQADEWRLVAENEGRPGIAMNIDQASVVRTGHTVTGWVMTVREYDPKAADWTKSLIFRQIDCDRNIAQMMQSKFYGPKGNLLEDTKVPANWQNIVDGSMLEGVAFVMCGKDGYASGVVPDPMADARARFAKH